MSEGRLTLRDGRTLAWCDYGPSEGQPLLRFQGTPGSRNSRYPHEEAYDRLGVHVIAFDRPGYGASTRLPGRGIAVVADDAAELLDHFGLDAVHVMGGSGGGPHALAFAANHPKRVRAVTVVVGAVPLEEQDLSGLIQVNRDGWYAARDGGWDAVYALLAPLREEILADPLVGFRAAMAAAPASDKTVMDDPVWQRVLVEDATEALRPGAEGWADEGLLFYVPWDFDPQKIECSVTWWHGEHDANSPISAVQRLLDEMTKVDLRLWSDAGHLEAYRKHDEILRELLSRG